jgi:hypothetical protein
MDKNRIFVGKVNDKTYDNIEDYNKAFLDAIGKDGTVTASIEFKPANVEQEQTYDPCLPDFELDELTGTAETDTPIIDNFIEHALSTNRIQDILDQANKMNTVDRAELVEDVKDMVESIQVDIEDNNQVHTGLLKYMSDNEQEINQFQAKLDDLKEYRNKLQTQINITEGADRVLNASHKFYDALYKGLNSRRPMTGSGVKVTGRIPEKGNSGFILDHNQKEIARKLFKEIFQI